MNWTDPEVIIRPDELDPPRLYGIDVVVCEGVYLGLLQVFNKWGLKGYLGDPSQADTMDVHLTFSRDGFRWERLANRPVFIPRGVIGSWDGGMIAGARMIEHGDEVRFYYSGHSGSHNAAQRTSGTGLATLPKDRFVARAASDELGVLITKPFRLEGDSLQINADAARGRIKVEVADPIGTPIPGLTVRDCRPIERDGLRLPVTWNGDKTLRDVAGQVVRLRFYLYQSKLYSFTVV